MTRTTLHLLGFSAAALCLLPVTALADETLSYSDILDRMVGMQRLATSPVDGENSGCFSSRDRKSQYNEDTGRYEQWRANHDADGYLDDKGTMLRLDLRAGFVRPSS